MRRKLWPLILVAALLGFVAPASAQFPQPVKWEVSAKKVKKNVYDIQAVGQIMAGWHIYDLQDKEGGPNPTLFKLGGDAVEPVGEPRVTSKVDLAYDDVFMMEIGTCDSPVTIVQRVKALQDGPCDVNVSIEWQACNDDILATGGTLYAAAKLVRRFDPKAVYANFIIEITDIPRVAPLPDDVEVTSILHLSEH